MVPSVCDPLALSGVGPGVQDAQVSAVPRGLGCYAVQVALGWPKLGALGESTTLS